MASVSANAVPKHILAKVQLVATAVSACKLLVSRGVALNDDEVTGLVFEAVVCLEWLQEIAKRAQVVLRQRHDLSPVELEELQQLRAAISDLSQFAAIRRMARRRQ